MYETYCRIFERLGLRFRAVLADTGAIGGSKSHEFHVLADSGEDAIAFSDRSEYAANIEMAEAVAPFETRKPASHPMEKVATPGKTSIAEVAEFLKVPPENIVKAIAVMIGKRDLDREWEEFCLLLLRGDHELNEVKAGKILGGFRLATDDEIEQHMGCRAGYIGPVQMSGAKGVVNVVADRAVPPMSDFVCGANEKGFHLTGVNWDRDQQAPKHVHDLRKVTEGDPSPDGKGSLRIARGIEVGHIFQLGSKYSEAMQATVLNEEGKSQVLVMGCYGIGVSRVVAAAIEQNHDERGIIWPQALAPYQVALAPINMHTSERLKQVAEHLYRSFRNEGIEVLFDDRKARPGVMFADLELIGIPHRVVVSERLLESNQAEYKGRQDADAIQIPLEEVVPFIRSRLNGIG